MREKMSRRQERPGNYNSVCSYKGTDERKSGREEGKNVVEKSE